MCVWERVQEIEEKSVCVCVCMSGPDARIYQPICEESPARPLIRQSITFLPAIGHYLIATHTYTRTRTHICHIHRHFSPAHTQLCLPSVSVHIFTKGGGDRKVMINKLIRKKITFMLRSNTCTNTVTPIQAHKHYGEIILKILK